MKLTDTFLHLDTEIFSKKLCITKKTNSLNDQVQILGWKFLVVSRLGRGKKNIQHLETTYWCLGLFDHEQQKQLNNILLVLVLDYLLISTVSHFLYCIGYNLKKGCCT